MSSGMVKNRKYKKGVALIFSMFVAALLAAMSTTVVAVSINHAKDSSVVSYNDAALQAANWGIEAAINYMGQPGYNYNPGKNNTSYMGMENLFPTQWKQSASKSLPGYTLLPDIKGAVALNNTQSVTVRKLDSDGLSKYGLYFAGQTLGQDKWTEGDSCLLKFSQKTGDKHTLNYYNGLYADVEVICTENRYRDQPSRYHLYSVAKIYNSSVEKPLSTRIVESTVREVSASDFMHFIQNARSWDANGVDLSWNNMTAGGSSARSAVLLPKGYLEQGRLRVDGYDINRNPENNKLKQFLGGKSVSGKSVNPVDGQIGFFAENKSDVTKNNQYVFKGEVFTARGTETLAYRYRGNGHRDETNKNLATHFSSLSANCGSMGLPQSGREYFDGDSKKGIVGINDIIKNKNYTKGTKAVFTIGANVENVGSNRSAVTANTSKCPDIAQGITKGYNNKGVLTDMPAGVPTFATVRVEICGDKVRILKYNTAVSNGATGAYVENITPSGTGGKMKISDIKDGVISVTGGNVEVVNVKKFNSAANKFGDTDTKVKASDGEALDGKLTVVSDVNQARDQARIDKGDNKSVSASTNKGGIYSDAARTRYEKYLEDTTVTSLAPPYSQYDLTGSGSKVKNQWPTPSTSSVEREGNVVIGSDITSGNSESSFGIVANNFIYLNDRASANSKYYGDGKNLKSVKKENKTLTVDGVLYSMDHSVQFDWNNIAGQSEKAFNKLADPVGNSALDDSNTRIFRLNGAIVGGFLDVEGDTHGRGYYSQDFKHNNNLKYNLPPHFPKWNVKDVAMNGLFLPYVVLSFEDKGAINDFQ